MAFLACIACVACFLPAVHHVKPTANANPIEEESKTTTPTAADPQLQVAWRYQDMLEEKMLGVASSGKAKDQQMRDLVFKYDNSKPMGNAVANLP